MSADDNQMPDWMDDEVKRKMKRRAGTKRSGWAIALIVLLVIIIPLACIGAFVPLISWASNSLQDLGDTANEFMLAVRDNQPQAAFELMSSSYQTQVGHSENLLASLNGRPEDWKFSSFDISNNRGEVSGTVQIDGATRNILIVLFYTGDAWRVDRVNY